MNHRNQKGGQRSQQQGHAGTSGKEGGRGEAQAEALCMGALNVMPRSLVPLEMTEWVLASIAGVGISLLDQRRHVHNAAFEPGLPTPEAVKRLGSHPL